MKKVVPLLLLLLANYTYSQSKQNDSIQKNKFNYKALIIPSVLIGYGVIGIESDGIKNFNSEIKEEINENIDEKISIDDFSQYLPAASVYGLNLAGIEGEHNFRDRTVILTTSYLLVSASVLSIKSISHIERPDGSSNNSFPSGHTATAFAGAEFLWQEYKNQSVWYGITGYAIATGTGLFRMYNDRHWLTDVAAGAGIGILCTKTAYWLYPKINSLLFKKESKNKVAALPYYNGKQFGFALSCHF